MVAWLWQQSDTQRVMWTTHKKRCEALNLFELLPLISESKGAPCDLGPWGPLLRRRHQTGYLRSLERWSTASVNTLSFILVAVCNLRKKGVLNSIQEALDNNYKEKELIWHMVRKPSNNFSDNYISLVATHQKILQQNRNSSSWLTTADLLLKSLELHAVFTMALNKTFT